MNPRARLAFGLTLVAAFLGAAGTFLLAGPLAAAQPAAPAKLWYRAPAAGCFRLDGHPADRIANRARRRGPGGVVAGVVVFAHHPPLFLGLFLFFMGFATAYPQHQDRLILREALLVAFFLAGLVVLGGQQQWWLQPLLMGLDSTQVFYGALALTAITDNAALTYLGSLVPGLAEDFKLSLVAGAVAGGGLTVVANAPNPAGVAILRGRFADQTIAPLKLLAAALPPTLVAVLAFRLL